MLSDQETIDISSHSIIRYSSFDKKNIIDDLSEFRSNPNWKNRIFALILSIALLGLGIYFSFRYFYQLYLNYSAIGENTFILSESYKNWAILEIPDNLIPVFSITFNLFFGLSFLIITILTLYAIYIDTVSWTKYHEKTLNFLHFISDQGQLNTFIKTVEDGDDISYQLMKFSVHLNSDVLVFFMFYFLPPFLMVIVGFYFSIVVLLAFSLFAYMDFRLGEFDIVNLGLSILALIFLIIIIYKAIQKYRKFSSIKNELISKQETQIYRMYSQNEEAMKINLCQQNLTRLKQWQIPFPSFIFKFTPVLPITGTIIWNLLFI